jgi:uncharacterized membrane protein YphA (DoxX/SURF4 family)
MQSLQHVLTEQHVILFVRAFLALVLLTAGIAKLVKRREFVEVVRNYRLLPERMAGFVGRSLPVIEVVVAIGLLLGIFIYWLAIIAIGLFLLFGSAVAINLLRGRRNISCGCFGPQRNHHLSWRLVIRNALFASLAAIIWQVSHAINRVERLPISEMIATMLVAGAALASWWLWGVIVKMWRLPDDGHLLSSNQSQRSVKRLSLVKVGRR